VPTIFKHQVGVGNASAGTYIETDPAGVTMTSDSGDIWDTSDSFNFAWKQMVGDCTIICRVATLNGNSPWAKAGIMIRESNEPGARNAALLVTPANGGTFQHRTGENGPSDYTAIGGLAAPCWLKLERRENVIYAATSADGLNWTPATGSPEVITMGSDALVGLALSAHGSPSANAGFDNISITGRAR
jgi:regulation of enolase protein 1 (concanavalin A-like superfamily)